MEEKEGNMNELKEAFSEYLNEFKTLSISEKRTEIINSINEISALMNMYAEKEGKELEFLKSKEILDLNDGTESEDDFLEAVLVYIENAKNLMGQYLDDKF